MYKKIWTADFTKIESKWLFLRKPVSENYIVSGGNVSLKLAAVKISDETGAPTMMLIRQPDIECTVTAETDFVPQNDSDEAGVAVYISNKGYYTFSKLRRNTKDYIVIAKNGSGFCADQQGS